jgi:hypothetical protein
MSARVPALNNGPSAAYPKKRLANRPYTSYLRCAYKIHRPNPKLLASLTSELLLPTRSADHFVATSRGFYQQRPHKYSAQEVDICRKERNEVLVLCVYA